MISTKEFEVTRNHPKFGHHGGHGGRAIRALCQLCGRYFYGVANHVRNKHKTTITDLIIAGKWKNERFPED